jgi:hypothetical protein
MAPGVKECRLWVGDKENHAAAKCGWIGRMKLLIDYN